MDKIKYILVDDEFFNRELIKILISRLDQDFKLVGEAESVLGGFEMINTNNVDVVFLDIKMPDGSGFDLLKRFNTVNFEVVFITGFDEYALKAFDYNAIDYVLKPIDLDKLKVTLEKVKHRIQKAIPDLSALESFIESIDEGDKIISKIPIHHNHKVILLPLNEIQYIHADGVCTFFYKNRSEKYTSSKQLIDFEFILIVHRNFIRISIGTYINLNFVESYSKGFECIITMKDGTVLEVSSRKKAEILALLDTAKKV